VKKKKISFKSLYPPSPKVGGYKEIIFFIK